MIIDNINGQVILKPSDENKRITNNRRDFFSKLVYINNIELIEDYFEVDKSMWSNFVTEEVDDTEISKETVTEQQCSINNIEELILLNDFNLSILNMQLKDLIDYSISNFNFETVNYIMNGGDTIIYDLLYKKINKRSYNLKDEVQNMLDVYYFLERIDQNQYGKLTSILKSQ